ncbi:MAG: hypothetical protein LBJ09_02260 [Clostridiales bacterium]|jgi:hypothetical protein|nr:hypothetical protein [Clostridiales bacterium]
MLQKHLRYAGSTLMGIERVKFFEEKIGEQIASFDSEVSQYEEIFDQLNIAQFKNLNDQDLFEYNLTVEINRFISYISRRLEWLKKLLDKLPPSWKNPYSMSNFLDFILIEFGFNYVKFDSVFVFLKKEFSSEINFRKLFNDNNFGFIILTLSYHYYKTLNSSYDVLEANFNSLKSIDKNLEMEKFIDVKHRLNFFESFYSKIFFGIVAFNISSKEKKLKVQENFYIILRELSEFVSQDSRFLNFRLQNPFNPIVQLMNANENLGEEEVILSKLNEFFSKIRGVFNVLEIKEGYIGVMYDKVEEFRIQVNEKKAQLYLLLSCLEEFTEKEAREKISDIDVEIIIDFKPIPSLPYFGFNKTGKGIPVFTDQTPDFRCVL